MKHLVKKYIKAVKIGEKFVDVLNNTPIKEKEIKAHYNKTKNGWILCFSSYRQKLYFANI